MSGFFDRLLARSADEEPAVRPRLDPWEPPGAIDAEPWGEVVDEVAAPVVHRRALSSDAAPRVARAEAPDRPARPSGAVTRQGTAGHEAGRPTPPPVAAEPGSPGPARPDVATAARSDDAASPPAPAASGAPSGHAVVEPASQALHPPSAPLVAGEAEPSAPALPPWSVANAPQRPVAATRPAMVPAPRRSAARSASPGAPTPKAPDVVISIGRIEVRAVPPAPIRQAAPPSDTSRLDRYLETRTGRAAR